MAGPITWRNVDGPDLGQASRGMFLAGQTFNTGFDKLGEVLKQQTDQGMANWDAQKANNTAAFMQQMRQYQTPEALAAAQASGALDPTKFQAQIDAPAVGAALDARAAILQQRGTANIAYNNAMRDDAEAGRRDQFLSAAQLGDTLTMNLLRNDPVREQAKLEQAGVAANQLRLTAEYAASDEGRRKAAEATRIENAPSVLAHLQQTTATSAAQETSLKGQAREQNAAALLRENEAKYGTQKQLDAIKAFNEKKLGDSLMGDGEWNTTKGRASIEASMKARGYTPDNLDSAYRHITEAFPNGLPIKDANGKVTGHKPLPTRLVQEALNLTSNGVFNYISGTYGGRTVSTLKDLLQDPNTLQRLEEGYKAHDSANLGGIRLGTPGKEQTPVGARSAAVGAINAAGIPAANAPQSEGSAYLQKKLEQEQAAQKKSPEVAAVPASPGSTALPVNRAVPTPKGSSVTATIGFSMGNPGVPAKPIDTSNTTWGKAQEVVSAGVASRKATGTKAFVLTVADGDTVGLGSTPGGPQNLTCRLDAIDAPETAKSFTKPAQPGQPGGAEALDTLKKLVANKEVTVTVTKPTSDGTKSAANNYGRALCQIDVQGKDVNSEMLSAGSAWLYEQFGDETPLKAARRELQNAAIANKAGIHGLAPQQKPWDYRREQNRLK